MAVRPGPPCLPRQPARASVLQPCCCSVATDTLTLGGDQWVLAVAIALSELLSGPYVTRQYCP